MYTQEYSAARSKAELVLEGIVLSEVSRREKGRYQMLSFICGIRRDREREQTIQNNGTFLALGYKINYQPVGDGGGRPGRTRGNKGR